MRPPLLPSAQSKRSTPSSAATTAFPITARPARRGTTHSPSPTSSLPATTSSIALLLEANRASNQYHPALTPNAVKAILQYTAVGIHDDLGVEYNALRKGAGALNTKGAIVLGKSIDTSKANGQWWLTSTPSPWTDSS
jgi:hypothetical protein